MDKKLLMQIIVVGAALLFITELFMFGGNHLVGGGSSTSTGGENISGYITFNGTIRTYDPYLFITSSPTESQIEAIRAIPGVQNVRPDPQGYIVDTETRDDVYIVGGELRKMNLVGLAVANIAAPSVMVLQFGTKELNITSQGVVRVATEPLLDAGEVVTVSMVGIANDGILIDYNSQQIALTKLTLLFSAEAGDPISESVTYTIPWEYRNNVTNESGTYKRVDSLVFTTPLTINQILAKKQFDYITYIDENSAQVLKSFDNKSQVLINFQDTNVTFPPSTLLANESLDLPYPKSVFYTYNLSLTPPGDFSSPKDSMLFQTSQNLSGNITLQVNALVAGKSIISIESVSLPS
jgi:hypothetical protein